MEGEILILLSFFLIIFVANTIQGITGFAGTLIAMPFLIMLMNLETARQVLNFTGILASILILSKDFRQIKVDKLKKILTLMLIGVIIGNVGFDFLPQNLLLFILPLFILLVGLNGLWKSFSTSPKEKKPMPKIFDTLLLLAGGVMHGLFVTGGPLLVAYMTKEVQEKREFRATLSMTWLILNTVLLIQSVSMGAIHAEMISPMLLSAIPLFSGIVVGGMLLKRMNTKIFFLLANGLLILSGISMLL